MQLRHQFYWQVFPRLQTAVLPVQLSMEQFSKVVQPPSPSAPKFLAATIETGARGRTCPPSCRRLKFCGLDSSANLEIALGAPP